MYTFEDDDIIIIPLDFNLFYQSACEYRRKIVYSKEYTITEDIFEQIKLLVQDFGKTKFIAIDMKSIASYQSRLFYELVNYDCSKVFFYNVSNDSLRNRISEDICNFVWFSDEVGCFESSVQSDIYKFINDKCKEVRKAQQMKIVEKLVQPSELGNEQLLDSSGLYSNCYVNVKRLFTDSDDYYFIIFCLAEKISAHNINFDAFISSSKNGAILANLLGGLLNKKVVHILGVGPKYSMELGEPISCVKKGKKYIYIFDFMCTGTELKIASALVNSKRADILHSFGIARYKKSEFSLKLFKNIEVLVDMQDMNVNYKIAGDKKDIMLLNGTGDK